MMYDTVVIAKTQQIIVTNCKGPTPPSLQGEISKNVWFDKDISCFKNGILIKVRYVNYRIGKWRPIQYYIFVGMEIGRQGTRDQVFSTRWFRAPDSSWRSSLLPPGGPSPASCFYPSSGGEV